jgi:hypothetical protein
MKGVRPSCPLFEREKYLLCSKKAHSAEIKKRQIPWKKTSMLDARTWALCLCMRIEKGFSKESCLPLRIFKLQYHSLCAK